MNLKKAKWFIPIIALLVIFESVLIVQRLDRSRKEKIIEKLPVKVNVKPEEEATINFKGEDEIALNEKGTVEVVMVPLKEFSLDGIDVLIEYNPEYLEILGTDPSDKFSYLARNWVEPDKKRVLVSMLETELPEGISFQTGEEVGLVTISYLPKKSGRTNLKIIGGTGETGTVLAENGTAKEIPFSATDFQLKIK